MKLDLIKNYIKKLNKEDISNYLKKEHIEFCEKEVNLIYKTIKENYENLENIDFNSYIQKYKEFLNKNLYNKIIEKYNEYKKFIE